MIGRLRGIILEKQPPLVLLEAGGVGYEVLMPMTCFYELPDAGKEAIVFTQFVVREDAQLLYGFATKTERELFRLLVSVSGVGGNTARMILSSITPKELCNIIAGGDERMLKSVKGIGVRTAQRIIVDLKDKIVASGIADELHAVSKPGTPAVDTTVRDEAVSALTMLGFSPAPSAKVVQSILTEQPTLPVEQVVKQALKLIK